MTSDADADRLMDTGDIRALLVIPEDFSSRIRQGGTGDVQVILNGDNANTATTVLGYSTAVLRDAGAILGGPPRNAVTGIGIEPRVWYNPELRSTLFLVPGLIAYIATITAVLSTALSIVREKEMGTMEQVRMAPISTPAFVLGKTLPYLIISQASAMLIVVTAMVLFDLPMRGSWLSLSLVLALFLVGGVGTGLLVSTMTDTQQMALQTSMLIAFLPTMILSGFIFPISSMPAPIQYVTTIVPARYFLVALRGIVLKGLSLGAVWPSAARAGRLRLRRARRVGRKAGEARLVSNFQANERSRVSHASGAGRRGPRQRACQGFGDAEGHASERERTATRAARGGGGPPASVQGVRGMKSPEEER